MTGWLRFGLYLVPYLVIGYDILIKAGKGIRNRQVFDENFLMAVATVGAFALALENAEVPEDDAYNVKVEKDRENDISIWQVEFETDYGDYEYEIASADGRIVGADYEVDEEWLDSLGGSPVDEDGARSIAAGKAGGASADEVQIWQESDDGRSRFEGELFWNGIKYEFELDAQTGIIFDWNADMRE